MDYMEEITQYHLHKDDYSQLHFEIKEAYPYCQKNHLHCFKPHRHSFYQLIWFTSEGRHFVDYETYYHPANSFFFINKRQVHYFCTEVENRGYLFHFDDLFLVRYDEKVEDSLRYRLFNEVGRPFVHPEENDLIMLGQLKDMLLSELKERSYHYRWQLYFLVRAVLLMVERLKYAEQPETVDMGMDFTLAMDFKALIEKHMNEFLSIEEFSGKLGVSSKKLTKVVKQYLKDTPAQILHQRKILEAKRLLSNTTLSIKEVAYDLGFDQPTYFTKYFKKHTQMTPTTFMEQLP